MQISPVASRVSAAILLLPLALLSQACDSGGPSIPNVDGRWVGLVPEVELEVTLNLLGQIENGVIGIAQLESPMLGRVQGGISGTQDGWDLALTIQVSEAMVAGTVVFDGTFQDKRTLSGTMDSGLLQGTWPVILYRERS